MFGIDDLIKGIVGGGFQLASNAQQNAAAETRQQEANQFNAQQAQVGRDFSAQQGQITRDYNSAEAATSRGFSAQQASISRDFNAGQSQEQRQFAEMEQEDAQNFNSIEAQRSRDFSEHMSSTAYQRATADMRAAGINPMVAYMQGGASTPSSSSASSGAASGSAASSSPGGGATASTGNVSGPTAAAAHAANVVGLSNNVLNSALDAQRSEPILDRLRADSRLTEKDVDVRKQDELLRNQQVATEQQRTKSVEADISKTREETQNLKRSQSQIGIGGANINPAYYADKISQLGSHVYDYTKNAGTQMFNSAKSLIQSLP